MTESDRYSVSKLEGDFVVAVGNAVATEISPEEGAGVPNSEERAFRVTYVSQVMPHTVESVDLGETEVHAVLRAMYMMQRASSMVQREALPDPYADSYDVICYLHYMLLNANDELNEREESERYEITPPNWVSTALS